MDNYNFFCALSCASYSTTCSIAVLTVESNLLFLPPHLSKKICISRFGFKSGIWLLFAPVHVHSFSITCISGLGISSHTGFSLETFIGHYVNPYVKIGLSNSYNLDETTLSFRGTRSNVSFLFHISLKFLQATITVYIVPEETPRSSGVLYCLPM